MWSGWFAIAITTDAEEVGSVTYVGGYGEVQRSVLFDHPASQTTTAYRSILVQMNLRSHAGVILFYPCYIVLLGVLMSVR